MSNEELVQAIRLAVRDEVNIAIRLSDQRLRDEVSTVVSASEQRLNARFDKLDGRIDSLETKVGALEAAQNKTNERLDSLEAAQNNTNSRLGALEVGLGSLSVKVTTVVEQVNRIEERVDRIEERVNRIDAEQHFIHADLTLLSNKLDKAATEINSLKESQITLETKVDENTAITKREMQKLHEAVQSYASDCRETTLYLIRRLDAHEALPADQAHPNSAA